MSQQESNSCCFSNAVQVSPVSKKKEQFLLNASLLTWTLIVDRTVSVMVSQIGKVTKAHF